MLLCTDLVHLPELKAVRMDLALRDTPIGETSAERVEAAVLYAAKLLLQRFVPRHSPHLDNFRCTDGIRVINLFKIPYIHMYRTIGTAE